MPSPLWKKLGIKADHTVALIHAPEGFEATVLADDPPEGVHLTHQAAEPEAEPDPAQLVDLALLFFTEADALARAIEAWHPRTTLAGGLWLCWPKKASKVPTDITFDVAQTLGLEAGRVDNKICAIDATWSALRLVIRVADRATLPAHPR